MIDPWFVDQIAQIVELRQDLEHERTDSLLREAKRFGYSDRQLGYLWGENEAAVRRRRLHAGLAKTFKTVDTCAAEFEAQTPYMYGTFEDETEVVPAEKHRRLPASPRSARPALAGFGTLVVQL